MRTRSKIASLIKKGSQWYSKFENHGLVRYYLMGSSVGKISVKHAYHAAVVSQWYSEFKPPRSRQVLSPRQPRIQGIENAKQCCLTGIVYLHRHGLDRYYPLNH
jgi:hypothetical protein